MSAPDLAVVIPARDAAATIRAAIDSVLSRAEGLAELLVVDDGSRDATASIASAHPDSRVRVIGGRGIGPAAARNDGVRAARSPLIGFPRRRRPVGRGGP